MNKVKRVALCLVAAVPVALAGLIPLNPAEATPATPEKSALALTCDPGEACIMDNIFNTLYTNAGNASPNFVVPNGGFVYNNGVRLPGLDHIQVITRTPEGNRWTICLHYGRTPVFAQPEPTAGTLVAGERVLSWRWRGECVGNEDSWHII
jgi:hypothetical protein